MLVCALVEAAPALASADVSDEARAWPPVVATSGSCPDGGAVQTLLAGLLPATSVARPPGVASVSDLGDSYLVAVGDRVKTYSDVTRDCAERARVAAAFISLVLIPTPPVPRAPPPPPPPKDVTPPIPPPKKPSPPPDEPTSRPSRWERADVRAMYVDAPSGALLAPGIALSFAAGIGRIGAQAVCGWVAGAAMSIPGETATVVLERFPCALGALVKLAPAAGPLEVDASASAVVGALRATGTGFASSYDSLRLEAGARASVDATLHFGPHPGDLAPVIGLEATYDPMPYDLVVLPRGSIGDTPSFWAGVSAGVSWSIP